MRSWQSSLRVVTWATTSPDQSAYGIRACVAKPRRRAARDLTWQVGQKKVDRCACTIRRTGVPQSRHGTFSRP